MLVLRPADGPETSVAWKLAMENTETPTALILSRQNIKDLPAASGDRFEEALQAAEERIVITGAYLSYELPDVVLVANGSEVSTLAEAAPLLNGAGIKVQVVSAPSEGLFFNQSKEYQESVIPSNLPVFGLTAGLPSTLARLVGKNGVVWGLEHFGHSAPYQVLDEKLGFTTENVLKQVKALLKK